MYVFLFIQEVCKRGWLCDDWCSISTHKYKVNMQVKNQDGCLCRLLIRRVEYNNFPRPQTKMPHDAFLYHTKHPRMREHMYLYVQYIMFMHSCAVWNQIWNDCIKARSTFQIFPWRLVQPASHRRLGANNAWVSVACQSGCTIHKYYMRRRTCDTSSHYVNLPTRPSQHPHNSICRHLVALLFGASAGNFCNEPCSVRLWLISEWRQTHPFAILWQFQDYMSNWCGYVLWIV